MHLRPLVLALVLVAAVALAGCTKDGDGGDPPTNTTTPTGGTTVPTGTTTPTPPTGGGNATGPQSPPPVTDSGEIRGQFTKEWPINVPAVSPRAVNVLFNLTGAQAGAPPTARVHLEFLAPDGTVLKSAGVGLGEAGASVAWSFSAADIAATGEYKLRATQSAPAPGAPGLPSGGIGNYQLYATVEY